MEAVNLLPAYARPGSRWATAGKDLSARRVLQFGGAAAGVAVIALGAAFVHERSVVNDKRDTLASVQAELTAAQAKAKPLRLVQSESATKLGTVRGISEKRIPWEIVLRDLARVLPSKVQLQNLEVQSPTPIAVASGSPASTPGSTAISGTPAVSTGFTVTGSASSQNRVALVLDRLAALPWLSNVTLQSSTRGTAGATGAKGADQFTISANFNLTGGAR
jgi:Tfp pilus assembly protein PilN